MKRSLSLLFISVLMLSGCTGVVNPDTEQSEITSENTAEVFSQEEMTERDDSFKVAGTGSNVLTVYFSRAGNIDSSDDVDAVSSASLTDIDGKLCGNAELIAGYARDVIGGDLLFIRTAQKYPSDYDGNTKIASDEMGSQARPELNMGVDDLSDYDSVILVYPIWWGTIPMPVATFLESYDFTDKKIVPVCTDGGSGMGNSVRDIKETVPTAEVFDGISVKGEDAPDAKDTIEDYLFEIKDQLQ